MIYKKANLDIVEFDIEDVITTSSDEIVPPAEPVPGSPDDPTHFPDED